jgi:hypothetical protein
MTPWRNRGSANRSPNSPERHDRAGEVPVAERGEPPQPDVEQEELAGARAALLDDGEQGERCDAQASANGITEMVVDGQVQPRIPNTALGRAHQP